MAFSFSKLFKGKPDAEGETAPGTNAQGEIPAPAISPAPAASPGAVRTVLPSGTPAPVSLRTPGAPIPTTPDGARPPVTRNLPVRPPARKVSFPVPSGAAPTPVPAAVPPPPISMTPPPAKRVSAPAPAPTLEAPDVAVNLEVGDFIDRIPPGFLSGNAVDCRRVVEFRASELYSDLSKGKASVPASTIYAKCPEIFTRAVSDEEDAEIQLPLQKLVEQLSAAFTTRTDQVAEENVGEIETPFLQVANEDNARLPKAAGTIAGAIRPVSDLPIAPPTQATVDTGLPQRPAHRTGTISAINPKPAAEPVLAPVPAPVIPPPPINPGKRPPSTVRASVAGGKIRLSGAAAVTRIVPGPAVPTVATPTGDAEGAPPKMQPPAAPATPSTASPSHQVTKKTARIQIPPISLRSGGAGAAPRPGSIPPPPAVPVQPSPVSIRPPTEAIPPVTFRTSPPPPPTPKVTARPFTPPPSFAPPRPTFPPPAFPAVPPAGGGGTPPAAAAPAGTNTDATDDRKIELGLAAVLRGQPSSALAVEPSAVPDDARLVLPFAMIERQLGTGRVLVPRETFVNALPEAHRNVLAEDSGVTEVQIPLQEVFQNLPGNALSIRQDQVVDEVTDFYPTPFAQKAEEDAQRLGGAVAPVAPSEAEVGTTELEAVTEEPAPVATASAPVEETEPETTDGSFASVFEEEASVNAAPTAFADQSVVAEEPVTVEEESARDVPLGLVQTPIAEAPVAEEAPATATEEPTLVPVTDAHPAEITVEPPAEIEPAPVEEALAVLESTAPGEDAKTAAPVEAPASVEAPSRVSSIPTPLEISAPETATEPTQAEAPAASATPAEDGELQTVFMTEDELDAKAVVRHVCQLPGITGCAVMFADGLRLAGNFPDGDAEGFSAMAPPFFKRSGNFASEALLGGLQAVTLYTDDALVSFFMHDDICLSVRHAGRGFLPGVREKLGIVVRELARMYSSEKPAESGESTL